MGETPITSMACISSRIVREPMSAQMAEPPAPEISSATMIGLACWTTASTLAAPVNDSAPSCWVSEPTCSVITAPNGIATSAVGRIVTLAMNQNCSISSRAWNGRLNVSRITLAASANRLPVCRSAPAPGKLTSGLVTGSRRGLRAVSGCCCVVTRRLRASRAASRRAFPARRFPASASRCAASRSLASRQASARAWAWARSRSGSWPRGLQPGPPGCWPPRMSARIACCAAVGRVGRMDITRSMRRCTACRSGSPGLGTSCGMSAGLPGSPSPLPSAAARSWASVASSFSSDMPIGPIRRPFTNWVITGLSLVSSTSRGPNMTRLPRNSMPMLSGTVRAIWMSCVTIRMVASISALRSISSCDR